MVWIAVGSKEWCRDWTNFHWQVACKYSERWAKDQREFYEIMAMYHMFESYAWADTEPWAKTCSPTDPWRD